MKNSKVLPMFIVSSINEDSFVSNVTNSKLVWNADKAKALRLTPKEAYHLDLLKGVKCAVIEA